jgi:hypothetical protein
MGEERLALWKRKADYLQRYLTLTRQIDEKLQKDAMGLLDELEKDVKEREELIHLISKVSAELADDPAELSEKDQKEQWLCGELFKQISEIEMQNQTRMQSELGSYRVKMQSNKQTRDTLGAYHKQMQAAFEPEGSILNKLR